MLRQETNYESPKFAFEELRLMEQVADTCWGYAYAWYDADGDRTIDGGEKVSLDTLGLGSRGCQGAAARKELIDYYSRKFNIKLDESDVATNTKSTTVISSNS